MTVLHVATLSWITALSWQRGLYDLKLPAMTCRTTQDGQVTVQSSDKMWSSRGGTGKPLQKSCHENPMNSMKSVHMSVPNSLNISSLHSWRANKIFHYSIIPKWKGYKIKRKQTLPQAKLMAFGNKSLYMNKGETICKTKNITLGVPYLWDMRLLIF